MKNNINFLTVWFAVAVMLAGFSCKKYEDGPSVSFRSAEHRLENRWKYSGCIIDGADKTTENFADRLVFDKDGTFQYHDDGGVIANGDWELNSDKTRVKLSYRYSSQYVTQGSYIQESFQASGELDILRLKEKECWLSGRLTMILDAYYPGGQYHETIAHDLKWELEQD